jgi:hypothetical protein
VTTPLTIERDFHVGRRARGRKELRPDAESLEAPPAGRVPRVSRLMALAIRFELLVQGGIVRDYAEVARLGHVSRARVSQVTSLLNLAPAVQEALLTLPRTERGRDPICLAQLLPIAATPDWRKQRRMWHGLVQSLGPTGRSPSESRARRCG